MLFFFLWILPLSADNNCADWTWTYHKNCNEIARANNRNKKLIFFEQENVNPFTQLVFSWNAIRPQKGYFSFYVQVRDAATQRWGVWHHMADWGANMQQSYVSKSDGFSTFVHVRLEIEKGKAADAFRVKVQPQQSASLSLVHNVSVALSHFALFKPEKIIDNLPSVHIDTIALIAQFALEHEDNGRICSPTSCAMVVEYLTQRDQDPLEFASKSFDAGLNVYGAWPCNLAHAFEQCNGKYNFFVRRMNGFWQLHEQLMQGMPVVVSVRGSLPGALKAFPHGHLMVVVGWDNDARQVLCHDPAAESHEKVFKKYPIADFLRVWECSHRLCYTAQKNLKQSSI